MQQTVCNKSSLFHQFAAGGIRELLPLFDTPAGKRKHAAAWIIGSLDQQKPAFAFQDDRDSEGLQVGAVQHSAMRHAKASSLFCTVSEAC